MTANEWVGIAVGVCGVSTSLLLGLRWVIKSYLQDVLNLDLNHIINLFKVSIP